MTDSWSWWISHYLASIRLAREYCSNSWLLYIGRNGRIPVEMILRGLNRGWTIRLNSLTGGFSSYHWGLNIMPSTCPSADYIPWKGLEDTVFVLVINLLVRRHSYFLFFGCAASLLLRGFFSSCSKQGLRSSCSARILVAVASLAVVRVL